MAFDEMRIMGRTQSKAGRLFIEAFHSDEDFTDRRITLDQCCALIKERLTCVKQKINY